MADLELIFIINISKIGFRFRGIKFLMLRGSEAFTVLAP
jgi:hypothetical protein